MVVLKGWLIFTVALYMVVSSTAGFQTCDNQTMAVQGFFSMSPILKFEASHECSVTSVISAVDGSLLRGEGEAGCVQEARKWVSRQSEHLHSWNGLYMCVTDFAVWMDRHADFITPMIVLLMLVAMNIGFVTIAVYGGQMTVATSLNLLLILHFCFVYLQKRKYAWKQKTRLQKRQSRLSQHCTARKFRVFLILTMFGNAWAMDATMANQIAELARAATMAATAASSVAEKVGVKSMSSGMESASKVLKNPDVFNGEDPTSFMSWKLMFETWMSYGDERFGELLGKVERMSKPPIYSSYDADQKSMANKFFAILSSYMRGRTSALVRSVASDEKDGFRLWYELCKEYLPTSKQRTLSLAQTLAQYPSFTSKSSMLEQILNFEQLVGQYESSSGNVYPGDLKAATILRCSPARVREYLQLSLKEESTYSDIREALLAYERVTKGYTSEQLLKQVQTGPDSEATPMEIDRIYKGSGKDSGKGKSKKGGKDKGRGFDSFPWSFGRGKGKHGGGRGKGRGKGKNKGKKGGKKGKGKQNKGGGKNNTGCFNCGDPRHWSKDCPHARVNQVTMGGDEQWDASAGWDSSNVYYNQQTQQQQASSSSSQPQQPFYPQETNVQRVQHQVPPPPPQFPSQTPQRPPPSQSSSTSYRGSVGGSTFTSSTVRRIFDLDLPLHSSANSSIRMISSLEERCFQEFDESNIGGDFFYEWFEGRLDLDQNENFIAESLDQSPRSDESDFMIVRVARDGEDFQSSCGQDTFIILDSGSDVSLLPREYIPDGLVGVGHKLKDCQGNSLGVAGTKKAEIVVRDDENEEAILRQDFLISDVTNCILSLGALMKKGWNVKRADNNQVLLVSPDATLSIPTYYRGSSLAIDCNIRCIVEEARHELSELENLSVRVVVKARDEFLAREYGLWQTTPDNTPFILTKGCNFLDPRIMWGHFWPYRSTLIRKCGAYEDPWQVVELSAEYNYLDDCACIIPECGDVAHDLLTIMGVHAHGIDYFGEISEGQPVIAPRGDAAEAVDIPLIDAEVGDVEPAAADGEEADRPVDEALQPVEIPEKVVIEDLEISATSPVQDLRRICRFFGISQSGSKRKMYERIIKCHLIALRRQALDLGQKMYEAQEIQPVPVGGPVRAPSLRERQLHELTHFPFREWCSHCIACKSRPDQHRRSDPEISSEREFPSIQLDFMFSIGSNPILVMIDCWTRYIRTVPMKTKSAKNVCDSLVGFIGEMGYMQTITVAHDNEPVVNSAVQQAKLVRNHVGLKLVDQQAKNFDKGRTAMAERSIQTLRAQSKTLIHALEEQVKVKFDDKHVIHEWSMMHSAWLINRFHVHSALKSTPYQQLHGKPFRGRIACFGSLCYGMDGKVDKHHPAWLSGIWLGKDAADHDILAVGDQKLVRCKAVRQTDQLWDAGRLTSLAISPSDLLKLATHSKVRVLPLPAPPPVPVAPTPDEAASDPPSDKEHGEETLAEFENEGVEVSPEALPALPVDMAEGASGDKRPMDDQGRRDLKSAKVQSYPVKHEGSATETQERTKLPKLERGEPASGASGSAGGLQSSPMHAANIRRVSHYGGVDVYVEDDEDHNNLDPYLDELAASLDFQVEDADGFSDEKAGPPEVDEDTLQQMDQEAALEEIMRLRSMSVIENYFEADGSETILDTRQVHDWRFRNDAWRRRCRLVAREFRAGAQSTEETFSPTSSKYVVNIFLTLALIYGLSILVVDIKDAFLCVPQRDLVIIEVPQWISSVFPEEEHPRYWRLRRCLPGQRRAALHWNEFFEVTVQDIGFESFEPMPTVFRHTSRRVFLTVHVDDVLLIGSTFDCNWCLEELSKKFSLKSNGPFPVGQTAELQYLKKNILVSSEGIVIEPCKQYIPKLIELLGVENRREKSCPHHNGLEVYDRERILPKELLNPEQTKLFRGGLGLCLYLAQDRPDIQEAVRVLSTFMGSPTIRAMSALKHLACYLKGTQDLGILLANCSTGSVLRDNWQHVENMQEETGSFNLECYCDSNWAGCKVSRKSTTSGMVFLNGNLILSMCKTQATVSLSSCEAELLAMTHMTAESIMIGNVCRFLLKISSCVISPEFDFVVYTDSSSAKSIAQRRGVGRLKHLDIRLLWIQRFVRERFLRLKKVNTIDNVADLNTKNLTANRRQYLFSLVGMAENQNRIRHAQSDAVHVPRSLQQVLAVLAVLPRRAAQSVDSEMMVQQDHFWTWISVLVMIGVGLMFLVWMIPRSRSHSHERGAEGGAETASERHRRYQYSELTEVSSPETWMRLHHHEGDRDEDHGGGRDEEHGNRDEEPETEPPMMSEAQRSEMYNTRIFLMFLTLVEEKFGRWGRRPMAQFEWEEETWTTDECLIKTFKQMRVMALCLDQAKLHEVEEMLLLIEENGNNELILAGLNQLEDHLEASMNVEMDLPESVAWLYHRYRDRMRGERFDRVRWAGNVFGSMEESARVAQERAIEAIESRMEMAYIRNDQDEYMALEEYRDRLGFLL